MIQREEVAWLNIQDYGKQSRKRRQPVSSDQDIRDQQRSVEQTAEKNLYISTHTVETLCRILDCRVEDVMEIVFDENEEPLWSPGLEEERQKQEEPEKKKKRQGQ